MTRGISSVSVRQVHPARRGADLLDQPPLSPAELGRLADLCAEVLHSEGDIVLVQSEAILALEAVARSVAGPGIAAINVVTGPYGKGFGEWMRQAGATVTDVVFPFDEVADPETVIAAIDEVGPDVVSLVHAEAATGGTTDVAPIIAAARAVGAVTVLDAVASIGAEPVETTKWDVDLVVLGGQKALAGPAGVSAVSVSERAWALIDANPVAPHASILSLTDWRDGWLRSDHAIIPGLPNWLEGRALIAALERVQAEDLEAVNARHAAAAAATRAGARELGLDLWQVGDDAARPAPIATALRIPEGGAGERLRSLDAGLITQGVGVLKGSLVRVNHYGLAASPEAVEEALTQLAGALDQDPSAALAAAERVFG